MTSESPRSHDTSPTTPLDMARLSDPGWFAESTLAPHSDHRVFASADEAQLQQSSLVTSLDGVWKFHYAKNPAGAPSGFQASGYDTSSWDDIAVPGHIQMQGYDRPQYVNTQYPWDGHETLEPGQAPQRFNPVASYVTEVSLDEPLAPGERVSVTFHGAESGLAVWLNGQWIGWSTDSFTPSEFDLTPAWHEGTNKLAVQVFKFTSQSWLEDQDFYRFSGLFRSVELNRRPVAHLRDLAVTTELSDSFDRATVVVRPDLEGEGSLVLTLEGVGELTDQGDGRWSIVVEQPQLWSAERPHLYDLTVQVLDPSGAVVEYVPTTVGVRRFEIVDAQMLINGQRIVFNGVNRHDFGLDGRAVSREQLEADVLLLKRNNVNAVRTSHYPNTSALYELCDRHGLYVIDEMNLETHGLWDDINRGGRTIEQAVPGDDPLWLPPLKFRAENMLQRDKNHPSVLIWSCGNESFGGSNLLQVSRLFKELDPTRPVHYEGVHWDPRLPETTDITSQMYTPAATVEEYLKEHREKPFILCEYAHSMGNSFGAVDKYVDLAWREPLFQGSFIWDFADQAIALTDRHGKEFFGYGGDCGEAPHDSDFSGNGIVFADRTPKPALQAVKALYAPFVVEVSEGEFTLTNRNLFVDSSQFDIVVSVLREGREVARATVVTAVAPLQSETYPLPLELPRVPGEYVVEVSVRLRQATGWAEAGHEIAFGQGVRTVDGAPAPRRGDAPEVVAGIHNIGVRGKHFLALFSRIGGGLLSYRYGLTPDGGHELLDSVPRPNFWHAPTSNERGWGMPFRDGCWKLASSHARPKAGLDNPSVEVVDDRAVVTYVYELPLGSAAAGVGECTVAYAVAGDGHIRVTVELTPHADLPDAPEFGMQLTTSADFDRLTWYGDGPDETQVDRRQGARLGVHRAKVADLLTPYLRPQEAGNRTGVRWATVTDVHGRGLRLDAEVPMELSVLPWTPAQIEASDHHVDLPPIQHTVIRPALKRRGVAGDDSWGAMTHPEYRLPAGERLSFTFGFQGVLR
ncbi:glycoside hydrolase family 2 TIM barrel-domain containing protein [Aestuariimicrobium kwangyangense]|uniref:glycoside hydrolase family 2 TIM barrel-domain containing protein n=1 Tax=Aestuariimicrobium kwangyangense TaxID=396389 RepID=UPI000423D77D|nr:glycoside hydrolase family 2 TIM barrel-domain containing protein [Aestuariimicrobium kwangyangense]